MKKKLREDIKLLAQTIIDEEQTFKTSSIKEMTKELYEKLSILEYLENQIGELHESEMEQSLDSKSFREGNWFSEPEPVPQPEHSEEIIEPVMEKIKDIVAQMPKESDQIDEKLHQIFSISPPEKQPPSTPEVTPPQNELEEFASRYREMPVFERKPNDEVVKPPQATSPDPEPKKPVEVHRIGQKAFPEKRKKSLNDSVNKGLNIALNDRLIFIKHLFDGKTEDYTRVLSQINTLHTYEEAESFVLERVKPDYNDWSDKEEYSERFMNLVEKRFI